MKAVGDFFDLVFCELSRVNFGLLVIIDASAYFALCVTAVLCCALSKRMRRIKKRPFLHAVNAFSAITLIIFLSRYTLAEAVAATVTFWLLGYLVYGLINLLGDRKKRRSPACELPLAEPAPKRMPVQPALTPPCAAGGVRLEHALSIADKLLLKNLGRGDRQELEKIKTTLTVLKVKGALTPQEGETLNEMFNALLKLMARYDL